MSSMQVEDTAAQLSSEQRPVRGMHQVLQNFTRENISHILAVGVWKVQEYQFVKGVRSEEDISSMKTLQGYFGPNVRLISECIRGKKYRYYCETKKRPPSKKTVLKFKPTAEGKTSTVAISATATTSAAAMVSASTTEGMSAQLRKSQKSKAAPNQKLLVLFRTIPSSQGRNSL